MSAGTTAIADVVVPAIFTPYVQQLTEKKSRIIQAGAAVVDASLSAKLAGGGLTFNDPSFKDLDDDAENVSSDVTGTSSPNKIGTAQEVQVRLSRNNSWASADLSAALAGADPMTAIANRVAAYWVRRLQTAFLSTMSGVFKDNATAPSGADTHTTNDMTYDVSGSSYAAGVTDFSAEAFIDASATMGDSMDDLGIVFMHSIVYARALKNNLIDFVPDASNTDATPNAGNSKGIPTFLGRMVVVDDSMPVVGGVAQTWIFGGGAVRLGTGSPRVPTEIDRLPAAGNGGGQEVLFNRVEWCIHPVGHAYIGTPANGGPSNATTSNNLDHADSWRRVFSERKQIKIARLITREY